MDPFIGEVRIFGFYFAPRNWALCNGQLLPISQNTALFSLLGTMYGGNGVQTFALPDLRSRLPSGFDSQGSGMGPMLGETGGIENVTLIASQMPAHVHGVNAAATADAGTPGATAVLASSASAVPYRSGASANVPLAAATVSPTGGNQPHSNMQPFLTVSFAIALTGIFPSRN